MSASRAVVQRPDFVTRRIAGETLIVPVSGHVMDLEAIYVVNEVGSRIWDLLQSPTSADRIAETLAGEFAVSAEQAANDVTEFLASLGERGLIRDATDART